jgi:hypothetical protein
MTAHLGRWCTYPDCGQISYDWSGLCELHTNVDIEPEKGPTQTFVDTPPSWYPWLTPERLSEARRYLEGQGITAAQFTAMFLPRPKE